MTFDTIDDLLPAHDLASLQALAQLLGSLDANTRLDRRQRAMSGTIDGR